MSVEDGVKRWYVVQAYSGYEKHVAKTLQQRIKLENLEQFFGQIIVPTEEVVEMRGGQKRKSERKFFPGYVLVEMEMNDQAWHMVRNTPRVLRFIGGKAERPAPLSEKEVDRMLRRIEDGESRPRPKVLFEAGEMVRVTDGPFQDFGGTVHPVDYEKNRLSVVVSIFGRNTPVDLSFDQVEKLD